MKQAFLDKSSPQSETPNLEARKNVLVGGAMFARILVGWWLCAIISFAPSANAQTTNVYYSGFETAQDLDDWSWGAPWEIGVPNSGPSTAKAGQRCAATVLAGNYTEPTDSRLVSPPLVVPAAASNPRLCFWQWFDLYPFGSSPDRGYVEVKVGDGAWQQVSDNIINSGGGVWTRPTIDLRAYAGQTVQVGFHFESARGNFTGDTVRAGWYIDEVLLLHDFSLALLDSPILRAQDASCIPLGIAASTLTPTVSFMLHAPAGHLGNLTLNAEGCWSGGLTSLAASHWLVSLTNSCSAAAMGVETAGTLCFNAVSAQSAFVPLAITDLDAGVTPTHTFGSRVVVIADEPLLESWLGSNQQRMVTLYGVAGQTYEIRHAPTVDTPTPWTPSWTNAVPASLFTSFPLTGPASSEPSVFLRAHEQ